MDPSARPELVIGAPMESSPWLPGAAPSFAGLWRRLSAFALDVLLWAPVLVATELLWPKSPWPIAAFAAFFLYLAILDAHGGTLGKRAFGIRVVSANGTPTGYRGGFLRHPFIALYILMGAVSPLADRIDSFGFAILAAIGSAIVYGVIVFGGIANGLSMLGDAWKRTLLDRLAGTYVVEV
jgi:uncharacterized RDD family membrane protein YckC